MLDVRDFGGVVHASTHSKARDALAVPGLNLKQLAYFQT